ncbi:MAG: hypothetical protein IJU91_02710 [Selenomonadaceae bacterium]|nr:hypothetical protein [Selenomonadaceae bacterium]
MTKIITTLPVSAEDLQNFKDDALKGLIAKAAAQFEEKFTPLYDEFSARFNADEWIKMGNKDVYYNNDVFGLLPNLANRNCNYQYGNYNYDTNLLNNLKFEDFEGDLPTFYEAGISFVNKTRYFRDSSYIRVCNTNRYGLTCRHNNNYTEINTYRGGWHWHGSGWSDYVWTIPFFRFGAENTKGDAAVAILKWFEYDLTPANFQSAETKILFEELKTFYAKYKKYLTVSRNLHKETVKIFSENLTYTVLENGKITFMPDAIFDAVKAGTEFDFLPTAKELLAANSADADDEYLNKLRDELLNGDKIRADIDPYDENLLTDPNRGHWDLWDYGTDGEKAGEIKLSEGLTARDPADDINHGIVAIDFGTKSTVVVYENDHLQILPLQVGSGTYGKGIKKKNFENPTVIQFINLKDFVAAYKARDGRPKTKWNDVTVSHTAFNNLTGSDSKHYYSFLTELKHWCGSKERIKIKDSNGVTEDLPPFMDLMEGDMNPLEYYAYYLGLYINNMLQEKRIFLKYIMSFPVTYDSSIRERMRRAFMRGLKKSFPTALLSNETAMKGFQVQIGASEPAAYAITALQEYGFDPEGDEENYYAVFDFGGGTTDFDFGVLRESELDRYDYELIHFGENGDKTLGGENLLKLLAFEIFKANQAKLLNPKEDDKSVGKIPFTFAADKQDFPNSAALIKDSQEAHLNMHNLAEKLRPVWEEPDSETAKEILAGDKGIEVDLYTDKGVHLPNVVLHTVFENGTKLDLKKILRDRIEQGIENFFIAMREAFATGVEDEDCDITPLDEVDELSIFLAGNSSKSKLVKEIFAAYLGQPESETESPFDEEENLKFGYTLKDGYLLKDTDDGKCIYKVEGGEEKLIGLISNPENLQQILSAVKKWDDKNTPKSKLQKLLALNANEIPEFKIYPTLGIDEAHAIQAERGIEVNPDDIAAPTGKTGVAFGLLRCRDSGNVKIVHITPTADQTPFQFYVGRNKKRKFKPVINKNTEYGIWYDFIDAGNSFDILYSDKPEAVTGTMDVQKSKLVNVTLENPDPDARVFIRAAKSNVIEYIIAKDADDVEGSSEMSEPIPIELGTRG